MPAKPSLKDRLGLNRPPPEDGEPDRTTAPIRGIKRRLNASIVEVPPLGEAPMAQASSSSSSMANRPYGSITRRIAQMSTPASATRNSAACASALPLLSLLKQDWAADKIPSWKAAAYVCRSCGQRWHNILGWAGFGRIEGEVEEQCSKRFDEVLG